MIIFKTVTECDFTNTKYATPVEGVAYLCRGATGRVCEVMWGGPEQLAKVRDAVITREEALERVEADPQSFPDF